MKRDDVLQLTEEALEQLAGDLARGQSPALKAYLAMLGRFHLYSFGNVMLIYTQKPDASRVAGFHAWRKLGRYVKKGEKGIAILAPLVYRKQEEDAASPKDVACDDASQERTVRGFKVTHVFDVSQTEGAELVELDGVGGTPGDCLPRLKAFVQRLGVTLVYEELPGGADGVSRKGEIGLRPDLSPGEEFAVLVHEVAHELLHQKERREQTTKTVRETEAEAVAFVVSQAVGLTLGARSSDYIQLYQGDVETLKASLDDIQKTAARIIEAVQVVE